MAHEQEDSGFSQVSTGGGFTILQGFPPSGV
jgi:hypothetical protein